MKINLSPQLRNDKLAVVKTGDKLTLNGVDFDFSQLTNGATLPASAIDSEWLVGSVSRVNGELELALILPHGPNPSQSVAYPEPIIAIEDGEVPLPFDPEPEPEQMPYLEDAQ